MRKAIETLLNIIKLIKNNNISDYYYGMVILDYSNNNTIENNNILNSILYGIVITLSNDNYIFKNNLIDKDGTEKAYFMYCSNKWEGNYWNKPKFLPKLILGYIYIFNKVLPWFNIDWQPAKEPYKIS